MRITADNIEAPSLWVVFYVPRAQQLKNVVWVDDDTHQWAELRWPLTVVDGSFLANVYQARLITINLDAKLALIDPVDDQELDATLRSMESTHG